MDQHGEDMHASQHVILVCDVHHFSNVAVELGDQVPLFIQEFYSSMGEIVVSRGGQIVGYFGDCIFFLFGDTGHLAAVQSALVMRQEFAGLLSRFRIRCESELETGISAGDVQVAVVGHRTNRVTRVFGTAVNEASLLGCHRGIAVTAPVKDQIESHYHTRRIPDMPVKWSDKHMLVWEVVEPGRSDEPHFGHR